VEYCRCGEQASFSIKGQGLCPGCVRQEARKVLLRKLETLSKMEVIR